MTLLIVVFWGGNSRAQLRPQVTVTAEPEKKSFVVGSDLSFRFSVTNNWEQHSISFMTCPPPYEVTLSDSQTHPVPLSQAYQQRLEKGGYSCLSTVLIEVKPGETWGPQVWPTPDQGMYDLKPGTYTGRLLWHFTAYEINPSTGKPDEKDIRNITISSNVFTLVVVPRT